MVDTLACGKFTAEVFLNEIHQRDDDLGDENHDHNDGPDAVNFKPAQCQEQQGVENVSHAVKLEFVTLRGSPCQPLGHFVMVEGVECSHRDLNTDQDPEQ